MKKKKDEWVKPEDTRCTGCDKKFGPKDTHNFGPNGQHFCDTCFDIAMEDK